MNTMLEIDWIWIGNKLCTYNKHGNMCDIYISWTEYKISARIEERSNHSRVGAEYGLEWNGIEWIWNWIEYCLDQWEYVCYCGHWYLDVIPDLREWLTLSTYHVYGAPQIWLVYSLCLFIYSFIYFCIYFNILDGYLLRVCHYLRVKKAKLQCANY